MPITKLRFIALTSETCRLGLRALQRGGPIVLPLVALQALSIYLTYSPHQQSAQLRLAIASGGVVVNWLIVLAVTRSCLGDRAGLDLLRIDRPALLLLGLIAAFSICTDMLAPPSHGFLQIPVALLQVVLPWLWVRATLLWCVSLALGDRGMATTMTMKESWDGLRGNFLRAMAFHMVWLLLLVLGLLAIGFATTGGIRHFILAYEPVMLAVYTGMMVIAATIIPAAIYRLLGIGHAQPQIPQEAGTVSA